CVGRRWLGIHEAQYTAAFIFDYTKAGGPAAQTAGARAGARESHGRQPLLFRRISVCDGRDSGDGAGGSLDAGARVRAGRGGQRDRRGRDDGGSHDAEPADRIWRAAAAETQYSDSLDGRDVRVHALRREQPETDTTHRGGDVRGYSSGFVQACGDGVHVLYESARREGFHRRADYENRGGLFSDG